MQRCSRWVVCNHIYFRSDAGRVVGASQRKRGGELFVRGSRSTGRHRHQTNQWWVGAWISLRALGRRPLQGVRFDVNTRRWRRVITSNFLPNEINGQDWDARLNRRSRGAHRVGFLVRSLVGLRRSKCKGRIGLGVRLLLDTVSGCHACVRRQWRINPSTRVLFVDFVAGPIRSWWHGCVRFFRVGRQCRRQGWNGADTTH